MGYLISRVALYVIIILGLAYFVFFTVRYVRLRRKADSLRAKADAALLKGRSVVYTFARDLSFTRRGKTMVIDFSERPKIDVHNEMPIILDPGTYQTVGTYPIVSSVLKIRDFVRDVPLEIRLSPGKEYELGIFAHHEEMMDMVVSHLVLDFPLPIKTNETLVLACMLRETLH
ncbi:MAG: hypothetical protein LBF41_01855 [Deltaproteobacteria bacterium]|jgi:hypothetical protein|nr:hypothetical protein [Deltaproteobacteria bacterium]